MTLASYKQGATVLSKTCTWTHGNNFRAKFELHKTHEVRFSQKTDPHGEWRTAVINRLAQQAVSGQPSRSCELERQKLLSSLLQRVSVSTGIFRPILSNWLIISKITSCFADGQGTYCKYCATLFDKGVFLYYICNNLFCGHTEAAETSCEYNYDMVSITF